MTVAVAAVVVAAGTGDRLGGATGGGPKALVELGGRTLLELALAGLRAVPEIETVVVVHTPGEEEAFAEASGPDVLLVPGGASRTDSVRAGVVAAPPSELVAIHDAARPLVPPAVVARTIAAVGADVLAAAPALPVADTLKRVGPDGEVLATVDRRDLWQVHTPQVVRRAPFEQALGQAQAGESTDDLGLLEAARDAGLVEGRIVVVRGDPRDIKITFPEDLHLAAALVRGGTPPAGRERP